ncbi:hypothetical protein [Tychonema sp. LEGE 07203]|uniref:hypothetical protein n=1 Tax=Tychonema sp. LEGE 07203 TaxID=1828671 RepID=UPI0018825303|nr:hypothetical protein [Tychonema sp. LEGE 07203]MBE9094214.1 hypothetical protein [Tychonema sp. LEGE 07203]
MLDAKRAIELNTNQIASPAKKTDENYRSGNIHTVTVDDLIMRSSNDRADY